jgi:predicted nuclease of predicted toxin-antitoxin system
VRLWIDECLSPMLVRVAQRRYEATCSAYRGLLRIKDQELYAVASKEEWVLVTNNNRDFRALTERAGLHSGLILLPQRTRADQPPMLEATLHFIERHSADADMPAEAWIINRVVEYHDTDNTISAGEWPPIGAGSSAGDRAGCG